jgi:hypothetical protein
MERLHPCPACARHVRSSERACPFCGASLASATPHSSASAGGRLGRAALFAFRTTAVAALSTLSACGDDQTDPPPPITTPPEETIAQPYGAPPEPPPPVPPVPPPPIVPDTTIAQPYGAPPPPQPPIEPPPVPPTPPTHDHERHERPPRTVTVPAYGISPHYGPEGPIGPDDL